MSDHGSFITQVIWCDQCFEAAAGVLGWGDKASRPVLPGLPGEKGCRQPRIIAGRVSGLYQGEEIHIFQGQVLPDLAEVICHPIRIAVIAEVGQVFLTAFPGKALDAGGWHANPAEVAAFVVSACNNAGVSIYVDENSDMTFEVNSDSHGNRSRLLIDDHNKALVLRELIPAQPAQPPRKYSEAEMADMKATFESRDRGLKHLRELRGKSWDGHSGAGDPDEEVSDQS